MMRPTWHITVSWLRNVYQWVSTHKEVFTFSHWLLNQKSVKHINTSLQEMWVSARSWAAILVNGKLHWGFPTALTSNRLGGDVPKDWQAAYIRPSTKHQLSRVGLYSYLFNWLIHIQCMSIQNKQTCHFPNLTSYTHYTVSMSDMVHRIPQLNNNYDSILIHSPWVTTDWESIDPGDNSWRRTFLYMTRHWTVASRPNRAILIQFQEYSWRPITLGTHKLAIFDKERPIQTV